MNNQQVEKIVTYFRINHLFHDPYQLLLDGNFLKLLVEKQVDLKRKFENAITGRASLRVTSCIMRELQLLGEQFRLVLNQARKHKTILCKHPMNNGADRCILDQIGQKNQRCWFVCTQDIQLRRTLRQFDNVPIVYFGPDQRVTMEDINKLSLKNLQREQLKKYLPKDQEMRKLEQFRRQQALDQKKRMIRQISSQKGIQIKTKIAKGPNPLSVKRKYIKNDQVPGGEAPAKRKRIRKHKQGSQQGTN